MQFDRVKFAGLRLTSGITQGKLAAALGVSRQTIARWERGKTTPSIAEINAVAEHLGVSGDDLVMRGEEGR